MATMGALIASDVEIFCASIESALGVRMGERKGAAGRR